MALRKPLNTLYGKIVRRPGYRQYLWDKLGRQLGFVPPPQLEKSGTLFLPGGVVPPAAWQRSGAEKSRYAISCSKNRPMTDLIHILIPTIYRGGVRTRPCWCRPFNSCGLPEFCEVGSWKGRSAINMARAVKTLDLPAEIVCVDTWLGSPEHWLKQHAEWYKSLRIANGMPQLYYNYGWRMWYAPAWPM